MLGHRLQHPHYRTAAQVQHEQARAELERETAEFLRRQAARRLNPIRILEALADAAAGAEA